MNTTVDEVRTLIERGATIINVGKHQGRREIRGAIRYRPNDLLTPEHLALPIAPEKPVVLYDEKGDGDRTQQIADKFTADGFTDVRILEGGFAAWERAGGETQEPSLEQIVPPMRASEVQRLDRRI
jgi:rhodanese-related sulfurtransferase